MLVTYFLTEERSVALAGGRLEQVARLLERGDHAVDLVDARVGQARDPLSRREMLGLVLQRFERRRDGARLRDRVKHAQAHRGGP